MKDKQFNSLGDSLFIRCIPQELKSAFKAYCASRNITMKQAIINFMKEKTNELHRNS